MYDDDDGKGEGETGAATLPLVSPPPLHHLPFINGMGYWYVHCDIIINTSTTAQFEPWLPAELTSRLPYPWKPATIL